MGGEKLRPRERNSRGYLLIPHPRSPLADRARSGRCGARCWLQRAPGKFLAPQRPSRGGTQRVWVFFCCGFFFLSFPPPPPPRLEGGGSRSHLPGWCGRKEGSEGVGGGAPGGRLPRLLLLHWCLPYGRKQPSVSQGKCFQYRLSDFSRRRRRARREGSAGGAPRRPQRARPPRLPPAEDALQHRHQGHGR